MYKKCQSILDSNVVWARLGDTKPIVSRQVHDTVSVLVSILHGTMFTNNIKAYLL